MGNISSYQPVESASETELTTQQQTARVKRRQQQTQSGKSTDKPAQTVGEIITDPKDALFVAHDPDDTKQVIQSRFGACS